MKTELLEITDLEIRAVDEAERLATVLVCRYGEASDRLPRKERFIGGAFRESVHRQRDQIKITTAHSNGTGKLPKGVTVARPTRNGWSDDGIELRAMIRFFDSEEGWEAYLRARNGELDGGSVGFRAVQERTGPDSYREIVKAELDHFMLLNRATDVPAYGSPRVLEVRTSLDYYRQLAAVHYDVAVADGCYSAADLASLVSE